jgi:hypothetical protein
MTAAELLIVTTIGLSSSGPFSRVCREPVANPALGDEQLGFSLCIP